MNTKIVTILLTFMLMCTTNAHTLHETIIQKLIEIATQINQESLEKKLNLEKQCQKTLIKYF